MSGEDENQKMVLQDVDVLPGFDAIEGGVVGRAETGEATFAGRAGEPGGGVKRRVRAPLELQSRVRAVWVWTVEAGFGPLLGSAVA